MVTMDRKELLEVRDENIGADVFKLALLGKHINRPKGEHLLDYPAAMRELPRESLKGIPFIECC
jgi:hypothetical protein